MLEPPTPAGEPFGTQEEENKTSNDFESVCVSLVERGWKIMPKKGTYPINKKGPRYVNLVDPRGNRKSIRVIDEALWEKLREAELRRTQKREEPSEAPKEQEIPLLQNEEVRQIESTPAPTEFKTFTVELSEPSVETPVEEQPQEVVVPVVTIPAAENPVEQVAVISEETISTESPAPLIQEVSPIAEEVIPAVTLPAETVAKAEIVENPPKEFQTFAYTSPGLQKSIFDLGFETLLNALQKETLSPTEIVSKIQEWSLESKNLLEFVHKSLEKMEQPPALPDTTEKDELISELQTTLRETEDKLFEIMKSSREI